MISSIQIKAWVPIDGLTHIATTYQIATDESFNNVIISERSEDNLNLIMLEVTIPVNLIYWARAMRHFDDSNADYWTAPIPVNNKISNHGLLLLEDIKVDTPTVHCDVQAIHSDATTFDVATSRYRGNDGHLSTHWIITDAIGTVLFAKLYDTENLTNITVTKNSNITATSQLKIKAIHVSSNNIESKTGELIVELNHLNFEITSSLTQIKPYSNLTLQIAKIDANFPTGLRRVDIKTINGELLWYRILSDADTTITIPWYVMTANSEYVLSLTAISKSGEINYLKTIVTTQSNKLKEIINPEFVYAKTFTKDVNILVDAVLPNGVTSHELGTSSILLPFIGKNDVAKATYNYINLNYDTTIEKVNGLTLLNGNNENTFVKTLENNLLLIDTMSSTGYPMFLVYSHTPKDDMYTIVNALIREDETVPLGKTNAVIQINATEILYIPYGSNILKKYNVISNVMTEVTTIELPNFSNGIMLRMSGDKLLIIGGTNFTMKVYSINDGTFVDGISTMPGSFINRNLKTVRLINGDYLIVKTGYKLNDTESSVLYFDYTNLTFDELPIVFNQDEFPTSVVTLLNGDVVFFNYTEVDGVGSSKQILFR